MGENLNPELVVLGDIKWYEILLIFFGCIIIVVV